MKLLSKLSLVLVVGAIGILFAELVLGMQTGLASVGFWTVVVCIVSQRWLLKKLEYLHLVNLMSAYADREMLRHGGGAAQQVS